MTSPNETDREGTSSSSSNDRDPKSSSSSSDSSSSSTDATSASDSPPRQDVQPVAVADADSHLSLGPRSHHDASYSAAPPRRSKKYIPPRNAARLGAIDEHSSIIAPDIPTRNQARKQHRYGNATKFFTFGASTRLDQSAPPVGAYDDITGPRGEKFGDLRQNKPFRPPNRGGWRRIICLGLVALILLLAIGLGVGLGVGLTRHKETRSQDSSVSTDGSNSTDNDSEPFPLGTWTIPTYLVATDTNCTSNPSTWRCYPYSTYSPSSPQSSFSTLGWQISSPTNSTLDLEISDMNPTFSYPFTDVSLQLIDTNDPRLSAFSFTFTYRKQVVPSSDITGTGAATRCYYNNTLLSVRMYSTAQGAGGDVTEGNTTAIAGKLNWPYAIEYQETISEGPQCFLYANGQETDPVTVESANGACVCEYRNYGLN